MTRTKADLLVLFAALIWASRSTFRNRPCRTSGRSVSRAQGHSCRRRTPFALREWQASPTATPPIRPFALLGGAVLFTAAALQQVGIVTATVTNTSFLTALYVVVTRSLLWLLRHERPGPTHTRSQAASLLSDVWSGRWAAAPSERFIGDMLMAG